MARTYARDTTVKGELIALNDEIERLADRALTAGTHADEIASQLRDIRQELVESASRNANLVHNVGAMLAMAVSNLGRSVEAAADNFGTSLIASAVIMSQAQREQDESVVWVKKVISCLTKLRSYMNSNKPISHAQLEEQMLFQGMSPHDAKYVILACLDRGYIHKVSDGKFLEIDDDSPKFKELAAALR